MTWKILWKSKKTNACLAFSAWHPYIGAYYHYAANSWEFCILPCIVYRPNRGF